MRRAGALLLAGVLLSGCGGGSDLAGDAAKVLQRDVAAVAAAARAHDGAAVRAAVTRLRQDVAAQRARDALSVDRAQRVLAAAAKVVADVPLPTPSPTPSPTATRTTAPKPAPAPAPHHKKRGKGEHGD